MIEAKYGLIAETTAEARELGSAYSKDGANTYTFALVDWRSPLNAKGKAGAELRRQYMDAQPAEIQAMYKECRTIGTPWVELEIATSTLHKLPVAQQALLKTDAGQFKMSPKAIKLCLELIAKGWMRIAAQHADYVRDLYEYWKAEGCNFGYAYERYKFGVSNRNVKDRKDGGHHQAKASFTLYRSEARLKNAATMEYYERGQNCGVSTANGER